MALALAQMGACVALNARSASALARVKDEVERLGGRAVVAAGDISQPDVVARLVAVAALRCGGIDTVINNAGRLEPVARIADSDPVEWRQSLHVNVLAPYLLTQAALPHLRRSRQGRVITLSSGAGLHPVAGWSAYCVGKAAINMFTAVLAAEEPWLTALAVRPGRVETDMQRVLREQGASVMPRETYEDFVAMHRRGALLPPEAPARTLAVLALHAPGAWSGRFFSWDEADIQAFASQWLT
jgi:NAD(P)-dependent dehydrogenase (short-subunit alcohol dehydrogenase family)